MGDACGKFTQRSHFFRLNQLILCKLEFCQGFFNILLFAGCVMLLFLFLDRLFEQKKTKKLVLIARLDLADERATEGFFTAYSAALVKKYDKRTKEKREEDFLAFDTPDGGVFFKCVQNSCVSLEGADRAMFDKLNSGLHWDTAAPAKATDRTTVQLRGDERQPSSLARDAVLN